MNMQANMNSSDPEALLQLAQKRFSNLIRSLPVGIIISGRNGTIEAVNPTVVRLFGYEERELVRQKLDIVINSPWKESSNFDAWCQVNLEKTIEMEGIAKDGDHLPIDLTVSLLDTDNHGRLIILIQDVTARFMAERLKHEFYQMINHDVRAPLSGVSAFLDALIMTDKYGTLNENGRERLSLAHRNVDYIVRLVSDLLELDRLDSGSQYLNIAPAKVSEFVEPAINSIRDIADAKKLKIQTNLEDGTVSVDQGRLVQVLVNLLSNAIAHSPDGGTIELSARQSKTMLRVSVRDHGRGIPAEVQPTIFERFRRGTAEKTAGFGLGLAICRQIVKQHGGTIGCENPSDGGALFWFELPSIFI
jgi:PAS domain S-box-containing protein